VCQLKERKKNKIMPDGIFDKLRNIASGAVKSGFRFAKSNLPTIAATALFGPAAGVIATGLTKVRNKKPNTKNAVSKAAQTVAKTAGHEAVHEATSGVFGTAIAKGGMNATHKKLVPSMKKTLTKKPVVPVHEATHKKMSATKKVVKKKPVPANMDNILNKKKNTRPDYY
tara:strand:+ start:535 stop:1044 length:510 start_codon:yes stop_codon:yes gene_type:complete